MELKNFLSEVREILETDFRGALSVMGSDIGYFVEHGTDSVHAQVVKSTEHLYKGVSRGLADVGHSAFEAGLHAFKLHHSKKASPEKKLRAHDNAHDSHMTAAEKLHKAGHLEPAKVHYAAADTHLNKKRELTGEKDEALDPETQNRVQRLQAVAANMRRLSRNFKRKEVMAGAAADGKFSQNQSANLVKKPV